jgi:hypothetical protein
LVVIGDFPLGFFVEARRGGGGFPVVFGSDLHGS